MPHSVCFSNGNARNDNERNNKGFSLKGAERTPCMKIAEETQGAEATLLLRSGLLRFTRNDEKSESRNDDDRGNKRG